MGYQLRCIFIMSASIVLAVPDSECRVSGPDLIKNTGWECTGQVHVITGGDSNIGLGVAHALAQANAKVVFLAHNVTKTQAVIRDIQARIPDFAFSIIPVDLTTLASTKKAVDTLLAQESRIDLFVGDAGAQEIPSYVTEDGFENVFELTYITCFYIVQRLLPKLRESHGRILLTGVFMGDPHSDGLCGWIERPDGCEEMHRMLPRLNRSMPPTSLGDSSNDALALYWKMMLARHIASTEEAVKIYSFAPGMVVAPYGGPLYMARKSQFAQIAAGFGFLAGSSVGLISGCILYCTRKKTWQIFVFPLLCIVLCVLFGYLFGGTDWGVEPMSWTVCDMAASFVGKDGWKGCNCRGPDGTPASACPMPADEAGTPAAYLAAAPTTELPRANGAVIGLCGKELGSLADPYTFLIKQRGEEGTRKYIQQIYDVSVQMISTSGQGKATSLSGQSPLVDASETSRAMGNSHFVAITCLFVLMCMSLASIVYAKHASVQKCGMTHDNAGAPLLDSERSRA